MRTAIDSAGRIVIPRDIRRAAGLEGVSLVDVHCRNGKVEIEPAPLRVRFEQEGRFVVAVPEDEVPPLTTQIVEATRDEVMDERARGR